MSGKDYAAPILRIALSLVFLYFGFAQVSSPDDWAGLVPEFFTGFGMSGNNIVMFNGVMELSLGIFLFIGLYTKFSSLVLAAHLFFISLSFGLSPIGARDFGLAIATFVVFLNGSDRFTLDKKMGKKKKEEVVESKV